MLDVPEGVLPSPEWHEVHRKSVAMKSWPSTATDATDAAGAAEGADGWDEFEQRASRISMLTNPMRVRVTSNSGRATGASLRAGARGGDGGGDSLAAAFPLRESQEGHFVAANPMTSKSVVSKGKSGKAQHDDDFGGGRTSWL